AGEGDQERPHGEREPAQASERHHPKHEPPSLRLVVGRGETSLADYAYSPVGFLTANSRTTSSPPSASTAAERRRYQKTSRRTPPMMPCGSTNMRRIRITPYATSGLFLKMPCA